MSLQMPPSAKKLVQNLKEVINKNCTDTEVYAVLLDCNMDPDDAIQRLLSQGLILSSVTFYRFLLFSQF